MGVNGLDQLNMKAAIYPATIYPATIKELFKEKDVKNRRLDEAVATYSRHECQDPRDKVYGFLGLVPDTQQLVVNYAKSTHQVFLDVVPPAPSTFTVPLPTAVIKPSATDTPQLKTPVLAPP